MKLKPIIAILALGLIVFFMGDKVLAPDNSSKNQNNNNLPPTSKQASGSFKVFSGQQFSDLYNSFAYPNTQQINETTPITGNLKADNKLRQLAIAKGYRLRSAPVTNTFVEVQKDMLLQQRAARPWLDMKTKAKSQGISLNLTAAYRSAMDQKNIFLDRLAGVSAADIAAGKADAQVNTVLEHTALPGYSRHHTGYTVDIACDNDPNVKFERSRCFAWLNKNNYLNAKTFGWMPSYPPGAGRQGPIPEPWEYVWVGTNALK